jgi:protoporphyrinogen oxidase
MPGESDARITPPIDAPVPDGDAPHVVVLGAGVSGLYAARTAAGAGMRVSVIERDDVVGGLAAGHRRGENYIDLGVHHLHAFDQAIFEDIRELMGPRLISVEKSALIRYGRGYRRYPLEFLDLLTGIPPWTLARAMTGLMIQQLRNRLTRREARNAEEALIQLYGKPLYRFFFRDFTARYWGMAPTRMSAAFVRRKMPRLSAVDVLKKALGRVGFRESKGEAVESALAEETLYYSRTGSREMPMALADYVVERGGQVLTGASVTGIEHASGRVTAVRFKREGRELRLPCDHVISTIPINLLVRAMHPPAPNDVVDAGGVLRHRPMVVYGLRVARERVLDALYVYYRNRVFHRLAEPKNSGLEVTPPQHTILLVEMMCELEDGLWRATPEALSAVMDDLEAEGLLRREEVVENQIVRAEHAYPVFDLGFEPHLERLQAYLATLGNLHSTGRQGGFCYPNMHTTMRMGADAADKVVAAARLGVEAP